jgi:hypothetical protein
MTGPYRMSQPKPDEDVELVPGDPALPGDQPVPRQPSPEDDPVDDEDPEDVDGKA